MALVVYLGVLLIPEKESKRIESSTCIRCGKCVSVCPMGLEPHLLEKLAQIEDWEETQKNNVMDCIECGSCVYTCPSYRPLLDYIRLGKSKVGEIIRSRKK